MAFDLSQMEWTRPPCRYSVGESAVEMFTDPHTDLWQRTYYHFRNDNAPLLQMTSSEPLFSFVVKTQFDSRVRFDQCGIVLYQDSENWLKASIEYDDGVVQHLGSVVTNEGWSDWATTEISADVDTMWYRLSRRYDDFRIECSQDGEHFSQMRICHMKHAADAVSFGIYAASPEESSFRAQFSNFWLGDCAWLAHDGQQPDENSLLG
ncbi:MAG: DUF1349 domain-containing protein [Atopobiaceae bacterium]|nr:DUF1349 domain-containing protein [Atopobiaceae bacterium]